MERPAVQIPVSSVATIFIDGVTWPLDESAEPVQLFGAAANNVVTLSLQDNQGTWELRASDDTNWTVGTESYLTVSDLPTDVYEIRVTPSTSAEPLPSFWVAWPTNAFLSDHFVPTGAVHGEIVGRKRDMGFHLWGNVRDDVRAGLAGNGAITQAVLWVDNRWESVALDAKGTFDITIPTSRQKKGLHGIALYAVDPSRDATFQVDAEYVSEKGWPLKKAPKPGRGSGISGGGIELVNYSILLSWSVVPVAKPRLDSSGLLILDGSESLNAKSYLWKVENLSSGASFSYEGAIASTENIPAGFYKVTLACSDDAAADFRWYSYPTTSFHLIIPPRSSSAVSKVSGALHIRWTTEKINRKWNWCFYVSGHVFDEVGATLFDHDVSNLEAWVTVNGERLDLPLDDTGCFLARYVAGVKLPEAYDLVLKVKTLDDGHEYEVDRLHETRLTIFPRH